MFKDQDDRLRHVRVRCILGPCSQTSNGVERGALIRRAHDSLEVRLCESLSSLGHALRQIPCQIFRWSADGFIRSGFPESQVWVVPHGFDPEIFKPPSRESRHEARARRGWDDSTLVILNVGMLSHNKGIKELLEAYNEVWKWHRDKAPMQRKIEAAIMEVCRLWLPSPED